MREDSRDDKGTESGKPVRATARRTDARHTAAVAEAGTAAAGLRHGVPTGPAGLLALQRFAGNSAVSRAITTQRHASCQGKDEEEAVAEPVQRSTGVHDVLGTSGRPLPGAVRQDMEARFGGTDFGDVRIHDDSAARRSAQEIGARAYTSGSHIVIGDGGGDRHTLAHELTHVVQQRQGPVAGTDRGDGLNVSDPSDRFEVAAEENARRVLSGPAPEAGQVQRSTHPAAATGHSVQRAGSSRGTATVDRPARRRRVRVDDLLDYFAYPTYTRASPARPAGRTPAPPWAPTGTPAGAPTPTATCRPRSARPAGPTASASWRDIC